MRKITRTQRHMCTNIAGLLRNMKGKEINFFDDDNGNPMSDRQVRAELADAQAKGHKLIGSKDCEGFDPFGGGCPGHLLRTLYSIDADEWYLINEESELMVNAKVINPDCIIHIDFVDSIILLEGDIEIGFDGLSEAKFLELLDK